MKLPAIIWLTDPSGDRSFRNSRNRHSIPLPGKIAERMLRFHLVDNTRGEPSIGGAMRSERASFISSSRTFLPRKSNCASKARPCSQRTLIPKRQRAAISHDSSIHSIRQAATRLNSVRYCSGGDQGQRPYTRTMPGPPHAAGRGVELASGKSPADRIAPQGARELGSYFGR